MLFSALNSYVVKGNSGSGGYLCPKVMAWAGIRSDNPYIRPGVGFEKATASLVNDFTDLGFEGIAALIERNL